MRTHRWMLGEQLSKNAEPGPVIVKRGAERGVVEDEGREGGERESKMMKNGERTPRVDPDASRTCRQRRLQMRSQTSAFIHAPGWPCLKAANSLT